ncbi:hypothetical protein BJX63DRAFT_206234 [Aspergillus granulosus]|uniref:Uncharacterized protein n=1 Tax=Aspergillus granulosus TaxID=176169 RepID=A0ABR4HEP3_9EURO
MPHSVRHWPGGIPSCIKRHPTGDFSSGELIEEVKGWLLFVKEAWVPRPDGTNGDGEYELQQRRALVGQWTSASQQFRDSFQTRAGAEADLRYPAEVTQHIEESVQDYNPYGLVSLAPVDEAHPANRARFIKFSILLYRFDPETGHCLDDSYMPQVAPLNPASPLTNSFEDFLPWSDLETADFRSVYLTRSGCVVYNGFLGPYLLIDEEGLKSGRLSLVQFRQNGTIEDVVQICPFNIRLPYVDLTVHMKELQEIRNCEGGRRHQNVPLDMDLPALDILSQARAANQLSSDVDLCDRDQWKEDIELYAPGYLALEEAGCGAEYDLTRLAAPNEIAGVKKRVWEKLITGQVPGFTHLANSVLPQQQQPQPQPGPQSGSAPMNIQAMLAALACQHAEGR